MLPDPALTLTIPSLHDGTVLDCRVHHPASLAAVNPRAPPWRRHAAVVAHPYAPMGGCYDDPVVEDVAGQLLRRGYVVGTFNFRGAGHSAGRTSWTAKPERDDFASFVGFMVYYIHHLDPFREATTSDESGLDRPRVSQDATKTLGPDLARPGPDSQRPPVLLMCGYSYGAMITTQLAPLPSLLEPFAAPSTDSNAAHIRLRAEHLAEQQNLILGSMRAAVTRPLSPTSPSRRSVGVRIGGDEGGSPRRSHDSSGRRSFSLDAEDKLRKGVNELLAKRRAKHGHQPRRSVSSAGVGNKSARPVSEPASLPEVSPQATAAATKEEAAKLPALDNLLVARPAYLLISPLQGLVTHLATMTLLPSRRHHDDGEHQPQHNAAETKLVRNPTLAVYGDRDVFVSVGKLRAWVARLTAGGEGEGSRFRGHEVATAGHFWAEEGVLGEMRGVVGGFARRVLEDG
ncbi:GPI transamidase component PIG-S [Tolypocladium paradoxum]|uniref:GPI transamidase component PIG-S n=1 Tax=Tolypocladium paradoxum TaxID=94208 RepID=A0A2S4L9J6_9HYPO|nr:GPI transamidase component PIG-S [Tolypocladium paradoxum]